MKLLVFLSFVLPIIVTGQSRADYEHAMKNFQKFYNEGRGDSINTMFGHSWDEFKASKPLWTNEQTASALEEFGTLKSFDFIGVDTSDPQNVYVFKTTFSKGGEKTTSLTLDKDNKLGTFRFITSSDEITELLKKHKKSS